MGCSLLSGKGDAAIWVLMIMGAIATTSHAQDLRDQEGEGGWKGDSAKHGGGSERQAACRVGWASSAGHA